MNAIDRAIAYFSPQRGLMRARARHAIRIYDGASDGRRASSWRSRQSSANTEIGGALTQLRDRARDLVRNTPYAPRALDILVGHTIGTGLVPVPQTGSDNLDRRVTELWDAWCAQADVEGVLSFGAMQALAVRSMVESGEVVLRFIDRRMNGEKVTPFQIQMLEGDFIDHSREGIIASGGSADTKRSRLGVGLGEFDRRTGLWLHPQHPGEYSSPTTKNYQSDFVPKSELIHLFRALRPGQVRGVSWFAPILLTMRDFVDFVDAVNVKARVEACFSAFLTNSDDLAPLLDETSDPSIKYDGFGNPARVAMLEPGMIKELKTGQDVKFAQPTSNTQVEPMLMFNLMGMASGIGVTYDQITGDLRQANYTSLRAGKIEFRVLVEQLQTLNVIPIMCQPVWQRFIDRSILAGLLRSRQGGYPCQWVTPAWEPVDPRRDLEAEKNAVRAGRTTPQEFIASWGNNWRTVLQDWKAFTEEVDRLDLTLDIDPRKTQAAKISATSSRGEHDGGVDEDGRPFGRTKSRIRKTRDGERGEWNEDDHPRDDDGKFTDKGGAAETGGVVATESAKPAKPAASSAAKKTEAAIGFVSPNTSNLTFEEAKDAIDSDDQQRLAEASDFIDQSLGLKDANNAAAIGAWRDGAENSLVVSMPGATYDEAAVAMAMKGYVGDQKSVVVFEPDMAGENYMARFEATGDLADIHTDLLKRGIEFHTLVPSDGGVTVYVFSDNAESLDVIDKAAQDHGSTATIFPGRGEFIGTKLETGTDREQRDDARREYERFVEEAIDTEKLPDRDVRRTWDDIRDRWSPVPKGTKDVDDESKNDEGGQRAALIILREWNEEDHPREPAGSSEGGQFTDAGGGGGGAEEATTGTTPQAKPSTTPTPKPTPQQSAQKTRAEGGGEKKKGKTKPEDFVKAKVDIRYINDKERLEKFALDWDDRIGEAPEDFKKDFLGGLNGTMAIEVVSPQEWRIAGQLKDMDDIRTIAEYTRAINWQQKYAVSDYLRFRRDMTGGDLGKKMLAGNVETYQKLGLEKVKVHANIDVGGYAWAKYGYVPTRQSWNQLSNKLMSKVDRSSRRAGGINGSGEIVGSWDEMTEDQQNEVREHFMEDSRDEFLQSEIDNWRDSGSALDDAKTNIGDNASLSDVEWAADALKEWREERGKETDPDHAGSPMINPPPSPSTLHFTNEQILAAISTSYQNGYEGRGDFTIEWDDDKLQEPDVLPSQEQFMFPGIEKPDYAKLLTEDQRAEIEKAITDAFDAKAESDAADMDAPDYLSENVGKYQGDYWDNMNDGDRYAWAERHGYLPEYLIDEEEEEPVEVQEDQPARDLRSILNSSNPKAIWALADSASGKQLLLGTDWYGELNLKDKQSMGRFNAYVGRGKEKHAEAA